MSKSAAFLIAAGTIATFFAALAIAIEATRPIWEPGLRQLATGGL